MDVVRNPSGSFVIVHAGREIDHDFATEELAWKWADEHIDDQVFDSPNRFSPSLAYRSQKREG